MKLCECSSSIFELAKWNNLIKNRKISFGNISRSTPPPEDWDHQMSSFSSCTFSEGSNTSIGRISSDIADSSNIHLNDSAQEEKLETQWNNF